MTKDEVMHYIQCMINDLDKDIKSKFCDKKQKIEFAFASRQLHVVLKVLSLMDVEKS